jgi:hypothetical protein
LAYERQPPLPITATPLKPETGKGYVIKNRQASEKPPVFPHCNISYSALQYKEERMEIEF